MVTALGQNIAVLAKTGTFSFYWGVEPQGSGGVNGLGFSPDLVIIRRTDSAYACGFKGNAIDELSAFSAYTSVRPYGKSTTESIRVTSLDTDGFTYEGVGVNIEIDGSADYVWYAFKF
jgi:hypothetical protein